MNIGKFQSAFLSAPRAFAVAIAAILAGCAVGPDYVRPSMDMPATYKEEAKWREAPDWKQATPKDNVPKGKWWEVFGNAQLNALEAQVEISNQNIKAAEAQYRQAAALTQAARSAYFPTISAGVSNTRNQVGVTASGSSSSSTNPAGSASGILDRNNLELDVSWEIDLWGRIRRTVESSTAGEQASAADLESAKLSAQAALAQNYFLLRVQDAQIDLLQRTTEEYSKSLQLVRNQYAVGVVPKSDVTQAETQMKSAQAQALDAGVQRAQLEHAIALLIGKAPADFSIAPAPLDLTMPGIPPSLPSVLLERRPDIAGAERRVVAANAQIGIARSAYFPKLTLAATGGYASSSLANLVLLSNRYWSLGVSLAETLFDAGLRKAQGDAAVAAYDQTVATYRQTVLTGLQQVEDNLAALRILEAEAGVQDEAVKSARESAAAVNNQYKAGTVNYLSVVVVQTVALNNERTALGILGRRLSASVLLITALGGGWSAAALP